MMLGWDYSVIKGSDDIVECENTLNTSSTLYSKGFCNIAVFDRYNAVVRININFSGRFESTNLYVW